MPLTLVKRNVVHKAWQAYCKGRNRTINFYPDFAEMVGMTPVQWLTFNQTYNQISVSEKTARKINVLAKYPAEHHHTLLKAIDAIYMDDPTQEKIND